MYTDNLRKVKDVAIVLLETPVKIKIISFGSDEKIEVVIHPFFSSRFLWNPYDTEHPFLDILSGDDAMQEAVRRYTGFIEKSDSIAALLLLMVKPYRLQFLKLVQETLSPDELGGLLANIWVRNENPNNDVVPLHTLIKWFKKASKKSLMDEEELAYYNSLPDEFTVYRGMAFKSGKKGISYTLSLEKAEWFAGRSQRSEGYILTGTARKKDVLAYFNGRNEQEILIEPKNILGLHEM